MTEKNEVDNKNWINIHYICIKFIDKNGRFIDKDLLRMTTNTLHLYPNGLSQMNFAADPAFCFGIIALFLEISMHRNFRTGLFQEHNTRF